METTSLPSPYEKDTVLVIAISQDVARISHTTRAIFRGIKQVFPAPEVTGHANKKDKHLCVAEESDEGQGRLAAVQGGARLVG